MYRETVVFLYRYACTSLYHKTVMVLLEMMNQHELDLRSTESAGRWICPSVTFMKKMLV
jgi:hypothetical protein